MPNNTEKLKNRILIVEAMALNRQDWVYKVRKLLEGALGEYAKIKYAELIDFGDYWSDEVERLLKKVKKLLSPTQQTKGKFDRAKAFKEAFDDASHSQNQITDAKNEFIKDYLDTAQERKDFINLVRSQQANFDIEELLAPMVMEYLHDELEKYKIFFD